MRITESKLRQIVKRVLLEARPRRSPPPDLGAISKRNKQYITSDASLFYWLRQNGNPLSIAHYSMEPFSMPETVIEMISENSFLSGFKCIGQISTIMTGYAVYLFANQNEYTVICRNHKDGRLIVADGILRREYELLVDLTDYMVKMRSGNAELDSYISNY